MVVRRHLYHTADRVTPDSRQVADMLFETLPCPTLTVQCHISDISTVNGGTIAMAAAAAV